MEFCAGQRDQFGEVEVEARFDLMGIGEALAKASDRIGGALREVAAAQADAPGLERAARAAPVSGHVFVLQPRLRASGRDARDG